MKNEKTNINRKKTEKRRFLHFFVFVKFDQKTKKKRQESKTKTKKTIEEKNRKNENKPNIKRKKKEHQVFFATISGFRSFAYIIRRNLTIFSSSRKGPQQLWRLALLHDPGDRDLLVKISMIHMNTQKQLCKQPKTLR